MKTKPTLNHNFMLTVRVPKGLRKDIDSVSRKIAMTRSNFVRYVLQNAVDTIKSNGNY